MKGTSFPFNYPPNGGSDVWPLTKSLSWVESWQQWPNIEIYLRDMHGNPTFEEMMEPVQFLNDVREVYWKNIAPRLKKLWAVDYKSQFTETEFEVIVNAIEMLSKPSWFSIYQRKAGLYKTFAMARFLTDEADKEENYGRGVLLHHEPAIFSNLVMGKYIEALLALPEPERFLKFDVSAHRNDINWSDEIIVLTEEEARELAEADIENGLEHFSTNWLSQMTGFPPTIFTAIQDISPMLNLTGIQQNAIKSLIDGSCGWQEFVDASIDADGIGNFLNASNGTAFEYKIFGINYVVFRTE